MALKLKIASTVVNDLVELTEVVRAEDKIEILHTNTSVFEGLQESFNCSEYVWTARFNDEVAFIWGVRNLGGSFINRFGLAWGVSGRMISRYPIAFLKISRFMIQNWAQDYIELINLVDEDYRAAHRWLKALGFTAEELMLCNGHPFRIFRFRRATWELQRASSSVQR